MPIHTPVHSTPFRKPHVQFSENDSIRNSLREAECCSNQPSSLLSNNRKEREPDKFDGENVEWPDYLRHFEQVAVWNRWSESEKTLQLTMSLRGVAQKILSELSPEQLSDYAMLIFSLSQGFCPSEREAAYRCEFRVRKRVRGESVSDYGYALNRIANRAFPNIPMSSRDNLVVDQYISGLGDLELKKYVQFAHPSTLDKAISLAVEYEAFESAHRSVPIKPRNAEQDMFLNPSVRALQKDSLSVSPAQTSCQNEKELTVFAEITKTMQDLQAAIKALNLTGNQNSRNKHFDRSKIRCYTCDRLGHTSRQCKEKRQSYSPKNDEKSLKLTNSDNHPNQTGLSLRPEVQSQMC
jgi:hypothetical protein